MFNSVWTVVAKFYDPCNGQNYSYGVFCNRHQLSSVQIANTLFNNPNSPDIWGQAASTRDRPEVIEIWLTENPSKIYRQDLNGSGINGVQSEQYPEDYNFFQQKCTEIELVAIRTT